MRKPDVRLRMFPADDADFEQDVTAAIQDVSTVEVSDEERIVAVADRLRARYRDLSIVPQDELATFGIDPTPTWYVFRDGRVRRPDRASEPER